MKLAFIKVFLHKNQRKTHSVTFDYLIASIRRARLDVETKICFSLEELEQFKPDIVGISSATESFGEARKLTKKIKERVGCIVIMGGTHITALPETLPEVVDIAVLGEGEETMVKLLGHLQKHKLNDLGEVRGVAYWNDGEVAVTEAREPMKMDNLPIPSYPRINYDFGEAIAVLTTRGCMNQCVHCSEQTIWRPFRVMSAQRLGEILEKHYRDCGATEFVFMDDISVFNLKRLVGLRDYLAEKNLLGKIKIVKVATNSELITEDEIKILKELGLKLLGFGLESASPRILDQMKGGKVKVEDFVNCMELCGKHNLRNGASSVWGFPGETLEEMEATKKFLLKYNGKNSFHSFMQYVCQPLPGSELWDRMYEGGKVSLDMDFSKIQINPGLKSLNGWFYGNPEQVPKERFTNFLLNLNNELRAKR